MGTVTPSKVKEFDAQTIEKIAYTSVKEIPTHEINDQFRLGYHVWMMLKEKTMGLEQAIHNSGARILIPEQEAAKIITDHLRTAGIELR